MAIPTRVNGQNIDASWFNDMKTEVDGKALDPTTSEGDLVFQNGTDLDRLPIETTGKYLRSNGTRPFWSDADDAELIYHDLVNAGFDITFASNEMTITLKQSDASTDPSSTNPVGAYFDYQPSGSFARGAIARTRTTALSLTVPSGATLGSKDGEETRFYLFLYWTGASVQLGLSLSYLDDSLTYGPFEITGPATIGTNLYGTTTSSGVQITYLGYFDITQATAGTWVSSPTISKLGKPPIPDNMVILEEQFTSNIPSLATDNYTCQFNTFLGDTNVPWFNYDSANDRIYLTRGFYEIDGFAHTSRTGYTCCYLYDQTSAIVALNGVGGYNNPTAAVFSTTNISGEIEINSTGSWHELRVYTYDAEPSGHGALTSTLSGNLMSTDVASKIKIRKIRKGSWA